MNVSHLLSILALAGVFPALRSCFANLATWRKFSNMEVGERHSLQARLSLCVCPALKPLPFSECIFCVFVCICRASKLETVFFGGVYLCVFAMRPTLKPLLFSERQSFTCFAKIRQFSRMQLGKPENEASLPCFANQLHFLEFD